MEGKPEKTVEGRARKERETARREEELTQRLLAEDERQQKEKDMAASTADGKEVIEEGNDTSEELIDGPPGGTEARPMEQQ